MPIFVGAVQDGSIFLNVVKLKRLLGDEFKFEIDINDDVYAMAAMQHYCRHHGSQEAGDLDPRRRRAEELHAAGRAAARPDPQRAHHGFDIDVQFCVDPVDNGALSSCPAGEGHTWGKVSVEAVETGSVYVHTDVTAVFPWLTHALLSRPEDEAQAACG